MRVIFHGEGDLVKGTGHLVRSLGMAADLHAAAPEWNIATCNSNASLDTHIRTEWEQFNITVPDRLALTSKSASSWNDHATLTLEELVAIKKVDSNEILFTDGKFPWNPDHWARLKDRFQTVVAVDNFAAKGSSIDAVLFPIDFFGSLQRSLDPLPVLTGPDWVWLHPALNQFVFPTDSTAHKTYDFSVLMGGADPKGLTQLAMQDLILKHPAGCKVLVLHGPAFEGKAAVDQIVLSNPQFTWEVRQTGPGFHREILKSKLTLCAFGLVAMELEHLGHPAVLYHHSDEHGKEAELYLQARARCAVTRKNWLAQSSAPSAVKPSGRPDIGLSLKTFLESKCQ